jgi:hypothetical protein
MKVDLTKMIEALRRVVQLHAVRLKMNEFAEVQNHAVGLTIFLCRWRGW